MTDERLFEKYMNLGEILNPKSSFIGREGTPIASLTYDEVGQLKHHLASPTPEAMAEAFGIVFRCKSNEFYSQRVSDFLPALNWLKDSIENLMENEKALSGDVDPLLEMAGVEKLARFGELNVLVSLGQRFGKSPYEVGQWKYSLVFALMMHDKVHGDIEKTYNELLKNESKRKG